MKSLLYDTLARRYPSLHGSGNAIAIALLAGIASAAVIALVVGTADRSQFRGLTVLWSFVEGTEKVCIAGVGIFLVTYSVLSLLKAHIGGLYLIAFGIYAASVELPYAISVVVTATVFVRMAAVYESAFQGER